MIINKPRAVGDEIGPVWKGNFIGSVDESTASKIISVTPAVDNMEAYVGQLYSGQLSVVTQEPDDGSYIYNWRFSNASSSENGLTISDPSIASPMLTGTPVSAPAAGYTWLYCYITDSYGTQLHGDVKITFPPALDNA